MKILFISALLLLMGIAVAEKKIVCYHGTWSVYRHSIGKFNVSNINPYLCTHVVYAFFGAEDSGEIRVIDPYLDLEENWGRGNIKQFNNLKNINPNLKTLAAVGGWNEGSQKFSLIAADSVKRKRFVNSSIAFLKKHNFDGLDLDWEYPAQRDGNSSIDKVNYLLLVKELQQELRKHNLLLTAAVASVEYSANVSYNIAEVSKYLDFINVMAYDLHGSWDNTVGINAPLYAGPADHTEKQKQLNVDAAVKYWLSQGAPADKIIVGLPSYGRTFTLSNSSDTKIGARNIGSGLPGPYTNEPGMIGYNELCEKLIKEPWTVKWENTQKVPYAYKGNQWVGYDNVDSVKLKTRYVINENLGGVMIWALETDDFRGVCGEKYPLLKTINRELGKSIPEVSTTTAATTTTAAAAATTTTSAPSNSTTPNVQCTSDGTFRDSQDCSRFYICSSGKRYDFQCPSNLLFDEKLNTCNYPHLVAC